MAPVKDRLSNLGLPVNEQDKPIINLNWFFVAPTESSCVLKKDDAYKFTLLQTWASVHSAINRPGKGRSTFLFTTAILNMASKAIARELLISRYKALVEETGLSIHDQFTLAMQERNKQK